jgi:hypothetical protein
MRIHLPEGPPHALAAELLLYAAVNTATIWLYLNNGFEWDNEPGVVQRFMW